MPFFSADHVFSAHTGLIPNGIVATDANGTITDLIDPSTASSLPQDVQHFEGLLAPGFINAHCHLELSHLKGQVSRHTGFVGFAKELLPKRGKFSAEEIHVAILAGEEEMYRNGIVAVGDICNTADTFETKAKGRLQYHSFVELLGLNPAVAEKMLNDGLALKAQTRNHPATLVPHAPYTVSAELLQLIGKQAGHPTDVLSIHNQESLSESEFFEKGTGRMLELYAFLGIDLSFFKPTGENSLRSALVHLPNDQHLLLVHNTFSSADDLRWAENFSRELYWCFCPKANLYIENRLPDYQLFLDAGVRITIGTDSLASNDTLSVLEELKVIADAEPFITTEQLLTWATKNGAEALRMKNLGTFEKGKRPGIIQLKNLGKDLRVGSAAEVVRVL